MNIRYLSYLFDESETNIHPNVKTHRQLLHNRIECLTDITRQLSSGITLSQSREMAVRHADKIIECQKRLVELKAYYTSLYD
jgi:transcription termination factor Rho